VCVCVCVCVVVIAWNLVVLGASELVCEWLEGQQKRLRHVAAYDDDAHHEDDAHDDDAHDDHDDAKAITERLMKLPLPALLSRTHRTLGNFATLSAKLLTLPLSLSLTLSLSLSCVCVCDSLGSAFPLAQLTIGCTCATFLSSFSFRVCQFLFLFLFLFQFLFLFLLLFLLLEVCLFYGGVCFNLSQHMSKMLCATYVFNLPANGKTWLNSKQNQNEDRCADSTVLALSSKLALSYCCHNYAKFISQSSVPKRDAQITFASSAWPNTHTHTKQPHTPQRRNHINHTHRVATFALQEQAAGNS